MNDKSPGPGHNLSPEEEAFAPLNKRAGDLIESTNRFLAQHQEIKSDEVSGQLTDFVTQLRTCHKEVEAARGKMKKPHMESAAAVDSLFNPLKTILKKAMDLVAPRQAVWIRKKQEKAEAAKRAEREAAEKLRSEAAEAARKSMATGTVEAAQEADALEDAAHKATKQADKKVKRQVAKSASGGRSMGLREIWSYDLVNLASVPPAYTMLILDKDAIALAIKNGARGADIPGLLIVSDQLAQ